MAIPRSFVPFANAASQFPVHGATIDPDAYTIKSLIKDQ